MVSLWGAAVKAEKSHSTIEEGSHQGDRFELCVLDT